MDCSFTLFNSQPKGGNDFLCCNNAKTACYTLGVAALGLTAFGVSGILSGPIMPSLIVKVVCIIIGSSISSIALTLLAINQMYNSKNKQAQNEILNKVVENKECENQKVENQQKQEISKEIKPTKKTFQFAVNHPGLCKYFEKTFKEHSFVSESSELKIIENSVIVLVKKADQRIDYTDSLEIKQILEAHKTSKLFMLIVSTNPGFLSTNTNNGTTLLSKDEWSECHNYGQHYLMFADIDHAHKLKSSGEKILKEAIEKVSSAP